MENYRHILCPTDFSAHCRRAIERARELADHYGAKLTLLHVIDYFPEEIPNDWIPPEDRDPERYLAERADTMLKELASSMELGEVELVSRMSSSSAKHEISDFAASREVDLIVMSSHARRGVFSLLGSTAAGVVHAAPCDVMVIRARE
jgi:Universal stress protein UspA and related nucleotide-binding proteins